MISEFTVPEISKELLKWCATTGIERAQNMIQTRRVNPSLENSNSHRNFWISFKTMIEEDILSLYSGALPRIIAFFPIAVTPLLADYFEDRFEMKPRIAGVVANTITYLIRYPFDYAYTKLTTQKYGEEEYKGILDLLKKRIKKDGFLSIYKGMGLSLLGIIVSHAVSVGVVVALRLKPSYTAINLRRIMFVLTIRFTLYPFDTVRKRLIVTDTHPDEGKRGYKNPEIFKELFAGFGYSFITGVYSLVSVLVYSAEQDRQRNEEIEEKRREMREEMEIERIRNQAKRDSFQAFRGNGRGLEVEDDEEYDE